MIFTDYIFIVFFIAVYTFYFLLQKVANGVLLQNMLLLVASYVFYASWDYRFLAIVVISTLVDYFLALRISESRSSRNKKRFLFLSVFLNLGILAIFKYLNFGIENFAVLLSHFGLHANISSLQIILPLGISFFTFQTMSYTIDVYREEIKPTRDLLSYSLYVVFFPQLVAGPIERAKDLLPQIIAKRSIKHKDISKGFYWIIIGYFLKIVIADNMAQSVHYALTDVEYHSGIITLLGVVAFSLQIYGDFAGYTYIARGVAKLMGIDLTENFKRPYLAASPREFWQRWHISLSEWLKNYLYFSLGGNRKGSFKKYRNIILTMLLGGLWHGASWNFVIWGAYHGLLLSINHLNRDHKLIPVSKSRSSKALQISGMYLLTLFGWFIFLTTDISQWPLILDNVFNHFILTQKVIVFATPILVSFILVIGFHLIQEKMRDALFVLKLSPAYRYCLYLIVILMTLTLSGKAIPFIYFQF